MYTTEACNRFTLKAITHSAILSYKISYMKEVPVRKKIH